MKYHSIAITATLAAMLFMGCNAPSENKTNPAPTANPSSEQNDTVQKSDEQKQKDAEEQKKKDLARLKKLADNGKFLRPITEVKLDVKKTGGSLSVDDGYRSYLYRKGSITNCYINALVDEFEAKGSVSMTLKYVGKDKAAFENYQSSIQVDGFDECIQKAVQTWPIPQDSWLDIELSFSSRPEPTLHELREMNRNRNGHDDHDDHAPTHDADSHAPAED